MVLILVASAWGSMLFFAVVVAPAVFKFLQPDVAGAFIRRLFPLYYLMLGAICAAATLVLALQLPQTSTNFAIMLLITLGFMFSGLVLMPAINRSRDEALAGNSAADGRFISRHRWSVVINAAQMALLFWLLWHVIPPQV